LPREFAAAVDAHIAKTDAMQAMVIKNWLELFKNNHRSLEQQAKTAPALRPALPISQQLQELSVVGIGLLEMIDKGVADADRKESYQKIIEKARTPVQECEILIVDSIQKLFDKVYGK
jgi:hypothetical protein